MTKGRKWFLSICIIVLVVSGCEDSKEPGSNINEEINSEYVSNEDEVAFEQMIAEIDGNDSFTTANSLFYTRENGESTEVQMFLDAKNEPVKMIEIFTSGSSQSICNRTFYLKDGKKIATRETLEEGEGKNAHFIERISYYDEKEKPIATKQKTAPYEEELELESYSLIEKFDCSMERALNVLNQEQEFATTFRGFVKEDPYLYIIVGEDDVKGYCSSLVVQYVTATIQKLQAHELEMIGTPLIIDFETLSGEQGYEYQILLSAEIR
jgi:hypothetical protein